MREKAQSWRDSQTVEMKEGAEVGKARRPSKGPVPSRTRAPPCSMGTWFGTVGNTEKITGRIGYGDVFILTGREHPVVVTAVQTRGEGSRK